MGGEFLNKKASIIVMDAATGGRTPGLQEVEVSGFGYGLGSALSLNLAINGVEVFLYGTDRDDQVSRNLLI